MGGKVRFRVHLLTLSVSLLFSMVAAQAKERLVMPYQCEVTDESRLHLQPSGAPMSYAILGARDQKPFTACVDGDGPDCRTVMVHQFDMSCGGYRVPWVDVVAAMGVTHESSPKRVHDRLSLILMARKRGSEKLPWQRNVDRARVILPAGFAPVGEMGARFVLPSESGKVIVTPESTSIDAYEAGSDGAAQLLQTAAQGGEWFEKEAQSLAMSLDGQSDEGMQASGAVETAALAAGDLPAWQTIIKKPGGSNASNGRGVGLSFFMYMTIAGILATAIFVGGYRLRRRPLLAVNSGKEKFFSMNFSSGGATPDTHQASQSNGYASAKAPAFSFDGPSRPTWQPGVAQISWRNLFARGLTDFADVLKSSSQRLHKGREQLQTQFAKAATTMKARVAGDTGNNRSGFFHNGFAREGFAPDDAKLGGTSSQSDQFRSGLNVIDIGFRYSEEAVIAIAPTSPLRDVLSGELSKLRQRQAVLKTTIADGTATPSRAAATMRRLTCELERIRKIADSAAETPKNGIGAAASSVPSSLAEAYAALGVNADVSDLALKKIVDGLRMSWHPDFARDAGDRELRDARIKQINIAWELIQSHRGQA